MNKWRIVALTLSAFTACDTATTVENEPIAPGSVFELQAFEPSSGQTVTVSEPSHYTIEFVDGERVNLRADCNVCSGSYQLSSIGFDVGLLACTLALCLPGSLETPYVNALGAATHLELRGEALRIFYPDGILRFTRS